MSELSKSYNESDRVKALDDLDLVDMPNDQRLDRITRLCTDVFQVEYAAVNIIDLERQWGKSTCGLSRDDINVPREEAICNQTIAEEGVKVYENTRTHEETKNLATVNGELDPGFYAGCPIYSHEELPIGTLCVLDTEPRKFSERERRILRELAAVVESVIQRGPSLDTYEQLLKEYKRSKRRVKIDDLCQIWDRGGDYGSGRTRDQQVKAGGSTAERWLH